MQASANLPLAASIPSAFLSFPRSFESFFRRFYVAAPAISAFRLVQRFAFQRASFFAVDGHEHVESQTGTMAFPNETRVSCKRKLVLSRIYERVEKAIASSTVARARSTAASLTQQRPMEKESRIEEVVRDGWSFDIRSLRIPASQK